MRRWTLPKSWKCSWHNKEGRTTSIDRDESLRNAIQEGAAILGVPEWGQDAADAAILIRDGLKNLSNFICNRPIRLNTFLDHTGEIADDIMVKTAQADHIPCYGGTLALSQQDERNVLCVMRLYFKSQDGPWQMKEGKALFPIVRFHDWETAPTFERLRQGETVEFPIDPPKQGG